MSYIFYKWLHLSSLLIMVLTTGLLLASAYSVSIGQSLKKKLTILHGTVVFLVFFAGFGLIAKTPVPGAFQFGWIWIKLGIWLFFGMLPMFMKRFPQALQQKLFVLYALSLVLAVYLITNKPF